MNGFAIQNHIQTVYIIITSNCLVVVIQVKYTKQSPFYNPHRPRYLQCRGLFESQHTSYISYGLDNGYIPDKRMIYDLGPMLDDDM